MRVAATVAVPLASLAFAALRRARVPMLYRTHPEPEASVKVTLTRKLSRRGAVLWFANGAGAAASPRAIKGETVRRYFATND